MTHEEFNAQYEDLPDNLREEFAVECNYPSWDDMVDLLEQMFDQGEEDIFLRVHVELALWASLAQVVDL